MESISVSRPLFYLIEHFEKEVSNWTLSEYVHMLLILKDLYADPLPTQGFSTNNLILTNFPFVNQLNEGVLEEDEFNTLKNT